jgi:hypothetical protein
LNLTQFYDKTLTPSDFAMLKVDKTFTVVVKEKFESLLVDHLGGGHSQSVLLAMEKLLKNSATLKGARTHPPLDFHCIINIFSFF